MDQSAKTELYSTVHSMTGINIESGEKYVSTKFRSYDKTMLDLLVEAGWDINSASQGATNMLNSICERYDLYRLNLLFECGLRIDNIETKKRALTKAKENSSNLVASRLNDYTPNICSNDYNNNPLHIAADENKLNLVKELIEQGADINARNKNGVRPLHFASSRAYLDIVSYLIEKGAMINCHDIYGRSALEFAVRSNGSAKNAVVTKLIEAGAKTDFMDNDKNTLLHRLLISQSFAGADILLDYCTDINQLNIHGESYLNLAAGYGPEYFLEELIEAGVDVKLKDLSGQSALHKALLTNSVEVVELLLKHGSDANDPIGENEYPIHLALKRFPNLPFVKALMSHGADLTVKDENGVGVIELALQSHY